MTTAKKNTSKKNTSKAQNTEKPIIPKVKVSDQTTKKKIAVNKKSIKKNKVNSYKPLSQEEIINNSIQKIKRLEDIHYARKKDEMISDKIAFWIFLLLALITNFFLSFLLIFLIIFLQDPLLYVIIAIIGISFGMIYSYLIHNLRYAMFHHHAFAKIFILLTGAINVFYIISSSTAVLNFIGVTYNLINIVGLAFTYFIAYLIPYFIELIIINFLRQ